MMSLLNRDVALGLLRHALTTYGGVLLGGGVMDADTFDLAVGALVTLAGVVWSVVEKKMAAKRAAAKEDAVADVAINATLDAVSKRLGL